MAEIKNMPDHRVVTSESQLSEQYRLRAENLMALALETSSSLGLPEFVKNFLSRAAGMMGAGAAVLALAQGNLETVAVHGSTLVEDKNTQRRLNLRLTALAANPSENFLHGPSAKILGAELSRELGWNDVTLAWLA